MASVALNMKKKKNNNNNPEYVGLLSEKRATL